MAVAVQKTWDDQRLKRDRLAQVQEQMKKRGIGALYLSDGINLRYILNMKIPGAEVFVPPEGDALAFIRPRDVGYVQLQHKNIHEPLYNRSAARDGTHPEEVERFAQGITDLMKQHKVAGEPLAADHLGVPILLQLIKSGFRLTDARPVIERSGAVKTPDEVTIYRCLGRQYAHAIKAFRDAVRPGITENELAGIVVSAWYEAGGEDIAQLNVCAGENMNPWRRWPTQRQIKEGEFVGVDLHGRGINGLRGDGSRTFFAGDRPTVEQRDLYRRAYDHLLATMDIFRAGRSFAEVVAAAPKVDEKYRKRLYALNIGHGAGLGSSGYPHIDHLKTPSEDTLKPNQVIAAECYFAEVGSPQAVKLEEMVLVREGKPEILAPDVPYDERMLS